MASKRRAASGSSEGLANFFFGTFFFLAKKKVVRSPFTKGLLQKSRLLSLAESLSKSKLFAIRFFEYEKSYLFHIQKSKKSHENKKVNAVALQLTGQLPLSVVNSMQKSGESPPMVAAVS